VKKAFWIAMDRCFREKVIKLAAKNTYRSRGPVHHDKKPDDDVKYKKGKEVEKAITYYIVGGLEKMLRINKDGGFDFTIAITAADLGGGATGLATIGSDTVYGYFKRDEDKRPKYAIKLDKKAVKEREADGTAGTIWHEMLHNAGLNHGSGGTYERDYEGFLIKEWGLAVSSDGVEGLGLTDDPYARKGCG
jgi:hypothetical protein